MQACKDDINNKNQQASIISETVKYQSRQDMNHKVVKKLSFSKEILQ